MNPHAALRRVGRIEYSLLRTPLGLVDEQVVQRFLGEDSGARQSFERLLDAVDDAARRWLTDPEGEARDAGFTSPEADPRRADDGADEPPAAGDAEPEQSGVDTPEAEIGTEAGAEAEAEAEEEEIEELADELLEQEETETFAGELAEDDELRRVQAELNAKRLVEEQHENRD